MTTTMCINECSNRGYIYAATEYGVECYCGNGIEKTSDGAGVGVDDKECNMTCDGMFSFHSCSLSLRPDVADGIMTSR